MNATCVTPSRAWPRIATCGGASPTSGTVKGKIPAEWDRYFEILQSADPYGRLRSIHHSNKLYDHGKPWVTHVSIQGDDFQKTPEWRQTWRKPVIFDECKYEG